MAERKGRGGNPPEAFRFKPGQSGNPGGRPRKQQTFRDAFNARLDEEITVQTDTGPRKMTVRQAMVEGALPQFSKDPKSFLRFLEWLDGRGLEGREDGAGEPSPDDLKLIEGALARRSRRARGEASDE